MVKAIEDGYTLSRTLPKVAFVEGRAEIKFRPAAGAARAVYSGACLGDSKAATRKGAELVAECVTGWNVCRDSSGKILASSEGAALPISADEVAKLPSGLFVELVDTVLGYAGGSEDKDDQKN